MTEAARARCDVLIVGGGPAGSTCARRLRAAGLDVLVMDRQRFPRDKVCAGWITPAVVELVGLDVADYGRARVIQPITAFRTGVEGRRSVVTGYDAPVSYGIRRCEFDHYLLERSGARLACGEALRSLRRAGARWIVNERLEAALVIGAGGHFCPVARHLGARPGRAEIAVTAQEIEFGMDAEQRAACRVREDTPELYFCADMKGYGWCFRKGDFLNIGIGREGTRNLSRHTAAFRDRLIAEGRVSASIPAAFHGHAYLLYSHARRPVAGDGVLLIGDAAGLAYPQSGEGIRPAVESALLAADVVIAAQGRYDDARLAPYAVALERRFGRRAGTGRGMGSGQRVAREHRGGVGERRGVGGVMSGYASLTRPTPGPAAAATPAAAAATPTAAVATPTAAGTRAAASTSAAGGVAAEVPAGGRVRRALATWLLGNPWFSRHVLIGRWFLHDHQPRLPRSG